MGVYSLTILNSKDVVIILKGDEMGIGGVQEHIDDWFISALSALPTI